MPLRSKRWSGAPGPGADLKSIGRLHLKARQIADAQALAQRSFDIQEKGALPEPKRAVEALLIVAACQLETDHPADASKTLRRAAALDTENARTLLLLGIASFDQNENPAAIEYLGHSCCASDANNPETFNYLGIARSQLGQPVDAERSLTKALELAPDYSVAHFNLTVIYATLNPPKIDLARARLAMPRVKNWRSVWSKPIDPPGTAGSSIVAVASAPSRCCIIKHNRNRGGDGSSPFLGLIRSTLGGTSRPRTGVWTFLPANR